MIDAGGWLVWTQKHFGIADKIYTQQNKGLGIVCHSIEGSIAAAEGRFLSTAKNPDGSYTNYSAASVMFENPKIGVLIQCYPITASTWTSGNSTANTTLWAVESEGIAGEPLNDNQVANMLRLAQEWEAWSGKKLVRKVTLWEHNEVWNWATPNAGSTSCPSGRYQPFYEALLGVPMADKGSDAYDFITGGPSNPKGEQELKDWLAGGSSLLEGYLDLKARLAKLEQSQNGNLTGNKVTGTFEGTISG